MKILEFLALGKKIHPLRIKRMRFILRGAVFFKQITELENVFDCDALRPVIMRHPKIYDKAFKPYLYCGLSIAKRFAFIKSNYLYLRDHFSADFIQRIYLGPSVALFHMDFSETEKLTLQVHYVPALGREGEICLALVDGATRRIYSLTFLFHQSDDCVQLVIGGIQGPNDYDMDKPETIRNLTKKMHGIRPRDFLIASIQYLCSALSVDELSAISTDNHVAQCSNTRKWGRFKADYSGYWEEAKGRRMGMLYDLPLNDQPKELSERPSRKRAMYARRQILLDRLERSISNAVRGGLRHVE